MKHRVEHNLDLPTARKVADSAWDSYENRYARYNPQLTWKDQYTADFSFNVKGVALSGQLLLEPSAIAIALQVPLMFRLFQKQAIEVIEKEIRYWIEKVDADAT